MKWNLITAGICAFTLFSCKPTQPSEPSVYHGAKFLLNEGAFTGGTATITALKSDTAIAMAFLRENGLPLGNIGQHLLKNDTMLYLTLNNGNLVRGFSASTMTSKFETTVISPRYLGWAEDRLYVTNWSSSHLMILDANSGWVVDSILVHGQSEAIYMDYPMAYVALNGGFMNDDRIAVVDLNTKTVDTLKVGDKPNSFAKVGSTLYVLCEGYQDWSGGGSSPASLWSLESDTALEIVEAPTLMDHASDMVSDGSMLYFLNATYNGALVKLDPQNATSWPTNAMSDAVGYGLDLIEDTLYLHNAKDFASAGTTYVLDKQGNQLDSIPAGVIPRQIIK